MTIGQHLDLRQNQTLVMTPQLQQAIKLLQMSGPELLGFVAEELEKNPLLERPEGEAAPDFAQQIQTEQTGAGLATGTQNDGTEAQPESFSPEEGAYGEEGYAEESSLRTPKGSYDEAYSAVTNVAAAKTLREHILEQIHMDFPDAAERIVAASLIELLDEAGYLPQDLELARAQLGCTAEGLERVIQRLQRIDPPGLFARSLKECLEIQLRDRNRLDPAMAALLEHLDLLAKREFGTLLKLCGVDSEDLKDMIAEIRTLTPKPALAFGGEAAPPIIPDVLLIPIPGGGWRVELNGETLPRVLANEAYFEQIQNGALNKQEKSYLTERWQQANWLIKALHQRATTILKVATEIVKRQDAFFVHGVQHLKPLTLKDVAEVIEMHESTVSRVTRNKYIATPRGLFELKYFFTNALSSTQAGAEDVSTLAVRTRIKELIDQEKPEAILSDDKVAECLRIEGTEIARRTVAKYRESLGIPSSAQRKRIKRAHL